MMGFAELGAEAKRQAANNSVPYSEGEADNEGVDAEPSRYNVLDETITKDEALKSLKLLANKDLRNGGCSKTSSFGTATFKNAVSQGFSLRNCMSLSKLTEFWNRLNDATGITATINSTQRNKILSNTAVFKSIRNGFTPQQHHAVVAEIEKFWKYAQLVRTKPDKENDVNILSIKRFETPVIFNNNKGIVYFTVKETEKNGHRIYSLELKELKHLRLTGGTPGERTTAEDTPLSTTSAKMSTPFVSDDDSAAGGMLCQTVEANANKAVERFSAPQEWMGADGKAESRQGRFRRKSGITTSGFSNTRPYTTRRWIRSRRNDGVYG
ncbi:MAG: hypothetical protein LBT00_03720 [Spirochaetaceae bacterium]|nr:hypothetical protein [Spirochaetaceae bacterium]